MGKNKKGGLIEDRVIRNPMEQMRRKQKFKDKEKRKETRFAAREARGDFKSEQHDPLLGHDTGFISQLRGHGTPQGDQPRIQPPAVDTQQESLNQWEQVQKNYMNLLEGKPVEYPQDKGEAQQRQPVNKIPQPSTLERKPIIYKSQDPEQITKKPPPPKEAPRQIPNKTIIDQKRQLKKKAQEVDDPLDPYKRKSQRQPSPSPEDEAGQQEVSPALQLAIDEEKARQNLHEQQTAPVAPAAQQRFIPAALRNKQPTVKVAAPLEKSQQESPPIKANNSFMKKKIEETPFELPGQNLAFARLFPSAYSSDSESSSEDLTPQFVKEPVVELQSTKKWGQKQKPSEPVAAKHDKQMEDDVLAFLDEIGE